MYYKKSKYKILLVDDDYLNFLYYSEIIPPDTYEIIYVNNGNEAVKICQTNKDIDLILMDIKMPGLDGEKALRKIRSFNQDIPVLIQSAYLDEYELDLLLADGATDYVYKPVREEELLKKITKIIGVKLNDC